MLAYLMLGAGLVAWMLAVWAAYRALVRTEQRAQVQRGLMLVEAYVDAASNDDALGTSFQGRLQAPWVGLPQYYAE